MLANLIRKVWLVESTRPHHVRHICGHAGVLLLRWFPDEMLHELLSAHRGLFHARVAHLVLVWIALKWPVVLGFAEPLLIEVLRVGWWGLLRGGSRVRLELGGGVLVVSSKSSI